MIQPARWEHLGCYWQTVSSQWGGGRLFGASDGSPHKNGRNSETKRAILMGPTPKRSPRRGLPSYHLRSLAERTESVARSHLRQAKKILWKFYLMVFTGGSSPDLKITNYKGPWQPVALILYVVVVTPWGSPLDNFMVKLQTLLPSRRHWMILPTRQHWLLSSRQSC
jgi:hypothetical protein